jgi:uroporphyrinogen-III synthase
MKVVLTRPDPDNEPLVEALAARGIECLVAPMLTIEPRDVADLEAALTDAQAVLVTSANGVRALAAADKRRDFAVIAVGDATAAAAEQSGFTKVTSADGDSAALAVLAEAKLDPKAGPLLHAAGSHVAGDLDTILGAAGFDYRRLELYESVAATALPNSVTEALKDGSVNGVVFLSPRTAKTFTTLVRDAALSSALRTTTAYCLSDAVAASASESDVWRAVSVAPRPRADDLLELVFADKPTDKAAVDPVPAKPTRSWASLIISAGIAALVALIVVVAASIALFPDPAPSDQLETRVQANADHAARLSVTLDQLTGVEGQLTDLTERVAALEADLAALPRAEGLDPAVVEDLRAELAATRSDLRDEIAQTESAVTAAFEESRADVARAGGGARETAKGAALLFAVGQLRGAAAGEAPFETELAAIDALAAGAPEASLHITSLTPIAATGAPTLATLEADFPAAADAILGDGDDTADAGWWQKTYAAVTGLVKVRRVGGDISGDDPDSVLARAEVLLGHGDIIGAVGLVESLDAARTAAADWIDGAKARAAITAGLDGLTEIALLRAVGEAPGQ